MVPATSTTQWRFFALSLVTHSLVLLTLLYPMRPAALAPPPEMIPVSILPPPPEKTAPPEKTEITPNRVPRVPPAPTRPSKARSIIAKKDSPFAPDKADKSTPAHSKPLPAPATATAHANPPAEPDSVGPTSAGPTPPPAAREKVPEQSVIAERQLPSLKELLPTANWSSSGPHGDVPISLNTNDPVYVTYFTKIKQLIESRWEYPEIALRYGLQGRLSLQFTIGANGQLEQVRMIRSSGSQVLDEEAVRAVRAAAPFPPIPSWIKPNPLLISASMEYHDNRLDYRFAR